MAETVKNRAWVKNAAIIFLAVMLVLTLFSNTIMNRALPEVAAQYATSGTITSKVRATAAVKANMTFDVTAEETAALPMRGQVSGSGAERVASFIGFDGKTYTVSIPQV